MSILDNTIYNSIDSNKRKKSFYEKLQDNFSAINVLLMVVIAFVMILFVFIEVSNSNNGKKDSNEIHAKIDTLYERYSELTKDVTDIKINQREFDIKLDNYKDLLDHRPPINVHDLLTNNNNENKD